ncbi:hypothetical protein N7474_004118 [Penicillium riverlandense]|uniref:uncharacterized protein n=1 Tax=Penicillium riverlandense TaxID=1903569 RepID=UPI0025467945|nr:uncharacterized protein N7474_004118 [Penicillium riverlandense]KAJ5818527.1 hypothetical protein N7474_004118 [Penicillium riverlandense]
MPLPTLCPALRKQAPPRPTETRAQSPGPLPVENAAILTLTPSGPLFVLCLCRRSGCVVPFGPGGQPSVDQTARPPDCRSLQQKQSSDQGGACLMRSGRDNVPNDIGGAPSGR